MRPSGPWGSKRMLLHPSQFLLINGDKINSKYNGEWEGFFPRTPQTGHGVAERRGKCRRWLILPLMMGSDCSGSLYSLRINACYTVHTGYSYQYNIATLGEMFPYFRSDEKYCIVAVINV